MKRDEVFVGLDLGGNSVRAAVVDGDGRILGQERHRLLSKEPPQVAEAIVRASKTACGVAGIPLSEVKAAGLGVSGVVEKGTGLVRSSTSLGWKDVPLLKLVQARAPKLPLHVSSELAVCAWGEAKVGAGTGCDDLAVVLVGAGVGAGLVLAGRLYEGATGLAGDLGHTKINVSGQGRQCSCGQRGCLDAYVSGHQLAGWARDDLRIAAAAARAAGKASAVGRVLLDHAGGDPEKITPAMMERAAHEGDDVSRRLLDEAGRLLGVALADLVSLLNPTKLLLGGAVLAGSPRMMRATIEAIDAHASKAARLGTQIGPPKLGENAGVVGAALLARVMLQG